MVNPSRKFCEDCLRNRQKEIKRLEVIEGHFDQWLKELKAQEINENVPLLVAQTGKSQAEVRSALIKSKGNLTDAWTILENGKKDTEQMEESIDSFIKKYGKKEK
jgi:hypothetical protein